MNKQEAAWLIVRAVGVYFLILATIEVANAISNVALGYRIIMPSASATDFGKELRGEAYGMFKAAFAGFLLKLGIYIVLGWYFLKRGNLIFGLLNKESTSAS